MLTFLRNIAIVGGAAFVSIHIDPSATSEIANLLFDAVGVMSGVVVACAIFFFPIVDARFDACRASIAALRAENGMPPLTNADIQEIRHSFDRSMKCTYANSISCIALLGLFCGAVMWRFVDVPKAAWSPAWIVSKNQCVLFVIIGSFGLMCACVYDVLSTTYDIIRIGKRARK